MSANSTESLKPSVEQGDDFWSNLLKPGSSLNPAFLLILDVAFAALLCIFLALLYLMPGSIHIIFLIIIVLCLWASVKWFVNELKTVQALNASSEGPVDEGTKKSQ